MTSGSNSLICGVQYVFQCLPNQPFFFSKKMASHGPPGLNPTGFPRWLMTRPLLTRLGSARGRVVTPGTWTSWRSKNLRRWCSEMSGRGVYIPLAPKTYFFLSYFSHILRSENLHFSMGTWGPRVYNIYGKSYDIFFVCLKCSKI